MLPRKPKRVRVPPSSCECSEVTVGRRQHVARCGKGEFVESPSSSASVAACGIPVHRPAPSALRELLIHQPAHAVGPEEPQHAHSGRLGTCAPHCARPLRGRGGGYVVEVQAEQVDGSDDHLHGTRGGELRHHLRLLLLHVRRRAEGAGHHGRQDEPGADDQGVSEEERPVRRHRDCALHWLGGIRGAGKHLRERDVLEYRRRRVGTRCHHQLAGLVCRRAHVAALGEDVNQIARPVRGGIDAHHEPIGRGPDDHVRAEKHVAEPRRHGPAEPRSRRRLGNSLVHRQNHGHHGRGREDGAAREDGRICLPGDRPQRLRGAPRQGGAVAAHGAAGGGGGGAGGRAPARPEEG
mmetsp:Transcript_69613/g.197476  ORF Transcript_69613/g.197476 Transcript_69613/m.197476 type:complete len:351 (+) Transcript_69613:257-1309(+)